MRIGLYFGSFNPIHIGHLIIANHIIQHSDLDKIWFVVSPQNPLKPSHTLLNEYNRLHLVELAIEDNPKFRASNIEFQLPKPSYTIDTLTYLSEKFPTETFSVIMGGDSFQNIKKWKNYEVLLNNYSIYVYNRPGFVVQAQEWKTVKVLDAPLLDISATHIRTLIKAEKSIKYLVPDNVKEYIASNHYYK
jgi:nicotinate-nucleotide adenylyltransferase